MKIAILLRSGQSTAESDRALQTAKDMLARGHSVSLYLLQDAVNFCQPGLKRFSSIDLYSLIDKNLMVYVLSRDAELRGIDATSTIQSITKGDYESLMDLLESSDRVIGLL
jgi:sulfur relay protein TusB/DsrH